jgi:hypothetical protein
VPIVAASAEDCFSLVSPGEATCAAGLRADWERLLDGRSSTDAVYQSPDWFHHLCQFAGEGMVAVAWGAHGHVVGLAPLLIGRQSLAFDVSARSLWKSSLEAVSLVGGTPLLPPDFGLHDRLLAAIWQWFPRCQCVYAESVPTASFFWQYLQSSPLVQRQGLLYLPHGVRPHHWIELPASFDEYLGQFGWRVRKNLKRQVRVLRDQCDGRLELRRAEAPAHVEPFADAARQVAAHSWQAGRGLATKAVDRGRLIDLARRGLLRSYWLECDGQPRAFVLGYQHRGVFCGDEMAYDATLARFSPGTVQLCLVIEDLLAHHRPRAFDLGISHAEYKQRLGNRQFDDALVFLLRRTWTNRARRAGHRSFRRLVALARDRLRKPFSDRAPLREQRGADPSSSPPLTGE